MGKYDRLKALEHEKGTQQLGNTVQVAPTNTGTYAGLGLTLLSSNLLRFTGTKFDVVPLRVNLAPWSFPAAMPVPAPAAAYAGPAPWGPPQPGQWDNFIGEVYARIKWGAGGEQNLAYVDWPVRGTMLQVSGSYLEVNPLVSANDLTGIDAAQLPLLTATLGFEPGGGGDTARRATFTYPKQIGTDSFGPPIRRWYFQVPPWARSFVPLVDTVNFFPTVTAIRLAVQPFPATIAIGPNIASWNYVTGANLDDFTTRADPYPLPGSTLLTPAPATTRGGAVVTVEVDDPTAVSPLDFARYLGCMFNLDL